MTTCHKRKTILNKLEWEKYSNLIFLSKYNIASNPHTRNSKIPLFAYKLGKVCSRHGENSKTSSKFDKNNQTNKDI